MDEILELRQMTRDLVAKMAALNELGVLSEEQKAEYNDLRAQVVAANARIERLEEVQGLQARIQVIEPTNRPDPDPQPASASASPHRPVIANPGFACLGELVATARFRPHDPRILALQEMDTGDGGGFAVPTEHDPMVREVSPQEAIFRPRATVIPAGDAPDAELKLPALNQGSAQNMYGGVVVDWIAEGGDKPETGAKLRELSWKPKEVSAHIVVTDKLLRNWSAASAFISNKLRAALLAAEDVAFQSGNGIGRPLGVLASPALKPVNRAVANQVSYADLVNMEAEFLEDGGSSVWVVSKRAIPQLRQMEDTAGSLIWNENAREGGVPTLLGRPVLVSYRSPALGSLGDVQLMDPKHYIIKDGFGVSIAASEHVLFKQNKTVVKAFLTVDGGPWLDGPVKQEDGQTYSPFVALDVP